MTNWKIFEKKMVIEYGLKIFSLDPKLKKEYLRKYSVGSYYINEKSSNWSEKIDMFPAPTIIRVTYEGTYEEILRKMINIRDAKSAPFEKSLPFKIPNGFTSSIL